MGERAFLTGATGFLGGDLLARLVADPGVERIYALCRARDDTDLMRRAREALHKLYTTDGDAREDAKQRIRWVRGDLTAPALGIGPTLRDKVCRDVSVIYHAAASTEFDLPLARAQAINLEGARKVLDLAREASAAGGLRRLVHISTAYVAGRRSDRILEGELAGPEGPFSNTYEETKAAAERLIRDTAGAQVPWTILRPSIVVGSSESGRTYNFNVLYFPIKLIHRGLLPFVPGLAATTLDIVPVDYVCRAAMHLGADPEAAFQTFHLAAGDDAIPLTTFCSRVSSYFNGRRADAGEPPVPPTRVIKPWRWKVMSWWLRRRLKGRALEQLTSFEIYLPYMLTEKRFDTSGARRLLEQHVPYPPIATYLDRVAEYAVTRQWGRRVSWDPALLESGSWSGGWPATSARSLDPD